MTLGSKPKKILLVAISENGCIGLNGSIPWHCSEDLKRFKKQTVGSTILMGRKTYESLGKPLPNRENIVVTRNFDSALLNNSPPGVMFCKGLATAMHYCRNYPEIFVIGGAEIYRQTLPWAHEIRVTKIPGTYDGDTFFPEWPLSDEWKEVDKEPGLDDPNIEYITYRRADDSRHSATSI